MFSGIIDENTVQRANGFKFISFVIAYSNRFIVTLCNLEEHVVGNNF